MHVDTGQCTNTFHHPISIPNVIVPILDAFNKLWKTFSDILYLNKRVFVVSRQFRISFFIHLDSVFYFRSLVEIVHRIQMVYLNGGNGHRHIQNIADV